MLTIATRPPFRLPWTCVPLALSALLVGACGDAPDTDPLSPLGEVENPKWFTPSNELRNALFGVAAVKAQFSIDQGRSGALRLHAQLEPTGTWYVSLNDGDLDTAGPAAGCTLSVTDRPELAFEFMLPHHRLADTADATTEPPAVPDGFLRDIESITPSHESLRKAVLDLERDGRDVTELKNRLQVSEMRSAEYHPIELHREGQDEAQGGQAWGDQIWAASYSSGDQHFGNAVIGRKGQHVIMLEWRGPALTDGAELLEFVRPHLDRLAALKPGEHWVEAWTETFAPVYETEE